MRLNRLAESARRAERAATSDQRGLSTLEWILLVAAVGGLATLGIVVVRGAATSAGDDVSADTDRLIAEAEADAVAVLRATNKVFGDAVTRSDKAPNGSNLVRQFCGRAGFKEWKAAMSKWSSTFVFRYSKDYDKDGEIDAYTDARDSTNPPNDYLGDNIIDSNDGYCRAFPIVS